MSFQKLYILVTNFLLIYQKQMNYECPGKKDHFVGERPLHIVKLPKMDQKSLSASLNSIANLLQGAYVGSNWAFLAFFLHKRAQ